MKQKSSALQKARRWLADIAEPAESTIADDAIVVAFMLLPLVTLVVELCR